MPDVACGPPFSPIRSTFTSNGSSNSSSSESQQQQLTLRTLTQLSSSTLSTSSNLELETSRSRVSGIVGLDRGVGIDQLNLNEDSPPNPLSLLELPLEVLKLILRWTCVDPWEEVMDKRVAIDPRSHGWMEAHLDEEAHLSSDDEQSSTENEYTKFSKDAIDFNRQSVIVLLTCRLFYQLHLPSLWCRPLLVTGTSISFFNIRLNFQNQPKPKPTIPLLIPHSRQTTLASLVKHLFLLPLDLVLPSSILLREEWDDVLPTLLPQLNRLESLTIGEWEGTPSLLYTVSNTILSQPLNHGFATSLKELNMVSFPSYAATDYSKQTNILMSALSSLISLKKISFSGLNLLDPDRSAYPFPPQAASDSIISYNANHFFDRVSTYSPHASSSNAQFVEEEGERVPDLHYRFDLKRSAWLRLREALSLRKVGKICAPKEGEGRGGLESWFMWQNSIASTKVLWDLLGFLDEEGLKW
ncbi:hypothetical protein T439DRAFT_360082 [Meredithblackwellia eburnea MCA 4105]